MYFGAIDTESLTNPLILNKLNQIRVVIDYEQNSTTSEYHHVFILKIPDKNINKTMNKISKLLKREWYSLYWKGNSALVQFANKVFKIDLENPATHNKAKAYGKRQNIQDDFLEFERYISRYKMFGR